MTPARPPESQKRRRPSWASGVWLVPLAAAVGIAYFVHHELAKEGPLIEISFVNGSGLEPVKTDLKYRGVKVGEVRSVDLSADLKRVVAKVRLQKTAAALARGGSLFWIVRPTLMAGQVKALGAVVTGPYIEAVPGDGPPSDHFEGLEEPLAVEGRLRALEIHVLSDRQTSFQLGAPVYYGAIKVGAVAESALTDDATGVRSRLVIERPYEALVRTNSQFWNAGGIHFHLGLKGLDVSAESLTSLLAGGIAFATPNSPGPLAKDGAQFTLSTKPKDGWKKWSPKIPLGAQPPESER